MYVHHVYTLLYNTCTYMYWIDRKTYKSNVNNKPVLYNKAGSSHCHNKQ